MITTEAGQLEVGRLRGVDASGRPLVSTDRSGREAAWLGMNLTRAQVTELAEAGQRVLLARPEGLGGECVILSLINKQVVAEPEMPRELILQATDRLVVQCGNAGMALHGDGRCEVNADRISQRARGVHTIKGAAVRIN